MSARVLIVEDEQRIADTLIFALEKENFLVTHVMLGADALEKLKDDDFDFAILDVGLPDISGFDVCKTIRQSSQIPLLFLTARDDEVDRIVGLEIGADDYVTKPFSPREVTARIKAILKRSGTAAGNGQPGLVHQADESQVYYLGEPLPLTLAEYRILSRLMSSPGRVYSRAELLDTIGASEESLDRSVDTHIKTLRTKLNSAGAPNLIRTRRGLGYSLDNGK